MRKVINRLTVGLAMFFMLLSASSCMEEKSNRTITDMGNGSWRFIKENREENQIDKENVNVRHYKEGGKSYTEFRFEAKGEPFKMMKILFANEVNRLRYRVESSNDGFKEDVKQEYISTKLTTATQAFVSDVSGVGNTVGFVKKVDYHYAENFVASAMAKRAEWRIVFTQSIDSKNKAIIPEVKGLTLVSTHSFDKKEVTALGFDDSKWEETGVPHCYNDMDTYLNISNAEAYMWQGDVWYRRKFRIDEADQAKRLILEFQGVSVGAAVYVNGHAFIGHTRVAQPDDVTNIGCFLPFTVDITDHVKRGEENILAVRVSNAPNSFYTYPAFGVYSGFGMGWGGIVAPVYLHALDPVHVAPNVYALDGKWGTYVATVSADEKKARIRADIQLCNDDKQEKTGTIVTTIIDNKGLEVAEKEEDFSIGAQERVVKEYTYDLKNPTLWYPNNSPYGKPAIHKLQTEIYIGGVLVDRTTTDFGIRMITWDDDYCYVNGKKHLLIGFGSRNTYPALGAAVPAEIQWRDVKYMADAGGNTLRVGHVPATTETLKACDYYGLMVLQNSGDNEWVLKGEPINTYKEEYDNRMIISQRNHASIIVWESNNGIARGTDVYGPERTLAAAKKQDYLNDRLIHNRDSYPSKTKWKKEDRIMVGYTNRYRKVEGSPSINTEVYGAVWNGTASQCIARFDFDNEKRFSAWYVQDYIDDLNDRACGWIDWMIAETQGEGYTIYLNGRRHQKSLGSSSMDGNRFPKLKYHIYQKALWVDYETRPGVALQTNWNLEGDTATIDAWSNCEEVELFVGEKSYGRVKPDAKSRRCIWEGVTVSSETLKAVGYGKSGDKLEAVCEESRERAGEPYAVRLLIEEPIKHPNGETFYVRANGSDAMLIRAEIVDERGNLCNLADNNIRFEVEGEGIYKGSYNFYITDSKDLGYHAPGDLEMQVEGGLMKVAIRSTLKAGDVKVKVSAEGLEGDEISFRTK